MRVVDVRGDFVRWCEARRLSPATVRVWLDGVERFARSRPDDDVRGVTRRDVEAWADELRRKGNKPWTVILRLQALRRFFAFLVETNRVFANPLEHWHQRRPDALPGPMLREADVTRLLATPNTSLPMGIRDRALLEVLYATGLRRKEVVGLAVFDVDLDGGLVRVRHGKGDRERVVPLTREAQKWLREYLREIRPRRARDGERALFVSRSGRALSPEAVVQILSKHAKAAGLARVSCHALRRTVATALLRGGADVREVAEVLGHSRLSTTQRYTRVVVGDLRKTHEKSHPRGDGRPAPPR